MFSGVNRPSGPRHYLSGSPKDSVRRFVVRGNAGLRKIECGICGEEVARSIVPHMKRMHQEEWQRWVSDFTTRWNHGESMHTIMRRYGTLFSWTVIEKELKRLASADPTQVKVPPVGTITHWRPNHTEFSLQKSTVWAFWRRGKWAVHRSDYRGNWPPQVPRNLILRYSRRRQTILDPFVGGGTTLIECHLEGRNGIGVDINPYAIRMTQRRIKEMKNAAKKETRFHLPDVRISAKVGDARKLDFIASNSIDLICAHPPYGNTLQYTEAQKGDLSLIDDYGQFCQEMGNVAAELFRVLKPGRVCAVQIGDIRKDGRFKPLEDDILHILMDKGFILKERIIKEQHHDRSTAFYLQKMKKGEHWIAHEYILILRKPKISEAA